MTDQTDIEYLRGLAENENLPTWTRSNIERAISELTRLRAENERLRASIGAIHFHAATAHTDTIRGECEHAIPELAALGKGGE